MPMRYYRLSLLVLGSKGKRMETGIRELEKVLKVVSGERVFFVADFLAWLFLLFFFFYGLPASFVFCLLPHWISTHR